jgi:hypothetical protein
MMSVKNVDILFYTVPYRSRESSVGIATSYGLDSPGSILGKARFSLLHRVQTDSGAHPAFYLMGTGGDFPGGKAAGA